MKRLTRRAAAVVAAGALIVAGCGDTDEPSPDSELDPAAEETTIDDPEPDDAEPASDDLDGPENADGDQYIEEYEEEFVAEESGVRLSVIALIINDVTSEDYANPQVDDDTQTEVVLEMIASNDAGNAVDFYPSQGTLQLVGEEVEPYQVWQVSYSESAEDDEQFAGRRFRDGARDAGLVCWQLQAPYDDVVAAGELTLIVDGAVDPETLDSVTSDMELVVTWEAP